MAKPIRNTPVLYGKDSKQFFAEIQHIPTADDRKKEYNRIMGSVEHFLNMAKSLKKE